MSVFEDDKEPPHDLLAEQSLLGAALLSKDAVTDIVEAVKPKHFYRAAHQLVFEAILELYAEGEGIDAITVHDRLFKRGDLHRTGGASYLHTLIASTPTAANASYYAKIVREKYLLRSVIEAALRFQGYGYSHEDPESVVERVQSEALAITDGEDREDYQPISAIMGPTLDTLESYTTPNVGGVLTGFKDFDDLTQGLHGGQMITVAARPAVGKTTWALDVASNAAKRGEAAVIFSLEMDRKEIMMRFLSAQARIPLHKMRAGKMNDEEWTRLAERIAELHDIPLFIDDSPQLRMMDIIAKCRRIKQRHNLRLVVIDYLQLMEHGGRTDNRQEEVSKMSRAIKLLAKELDVPIIAVSQLNRGPEQRTDKRPLISDLRESGSIEQDSDMVILIHREDVYDKESPRAGEADLIVGKHRNGPTATITVAFQGHYSRFVDMARH